MRIPVLSGGQQWLVSWHSLPEPPDGTRTAPRAFCMTAEGGTRRDLTGNPAPGDGRGSVRDRRPGQAARRHARSVP